MIKNTYDSLGRITGINYSHNDKTLADYHYKWDAANRITEINDDKYGYDKTSQLLSAVYAKKPKEQYAYDLNGNRLTALLQGQEKKYETGNFNRLLSENGEKLEYDAEGNRISKGNTKYFWDHRNRLIKVVSPSETIEYTYDYQNRLVKRSADKNITHFVHDGWQIVRQCENGKPVKRFLWGTKQDELICENDQWTLGDHLNTIREVVNSDGKVIAHCDYNAFGKRLNAAESSLQFAYTGKLTDTATGLQWNINRWYDANAGRWISEDPIGFRGKDENLYRYVGNMPLLSTDSNGTAAQKCQPTEKRKQECCDIGEKANKDLVRTGGGSVMCCDGVPVSCNWHPDRNDAPKSRVQSVLNKCIMAHEDEHHNDVNCTSDRVYRPNMKNYFPSANDKAECKAFQVQINCMKEELKNLTPDEQKRVQRLMQLYADEGNKTYKCKKYNMEIK